MLDVWQSSLERPAASAEQQRKRWRSTLFLILNLLPWTNDTHRRLGLRIAIADVNEPGLAAVGEEITAIQKSLPEDIKIVQSRAHSSDGDSHSSANLLIFPTDVSKADEVVRLRDRVYEAWGEVGLN
jgi:hypothetical protein